MDWRVWFVSSAASFDVPFISCGSHAVPAVPAPVGLGKFRLVGDLPGAASAPSIHRQPLSPLSAYLVPCAALASAAAAYVLRIHRRTWRYEPRAAAVLILAPIVALQPVAAVVTAAIVTAAFVWGAQILRRLGLTTSGAAAGLAFPAILGFAFFSVMLFAPGTLRLLNPWLLSSAGGRFRPGLGRVWCGSTRPGEVAGRCLAPATDRFRRRAFSPAAD